MESGFSSSIEILFNKMENFITTSTVVGEPISLNNIVLLPLIDVNFAVGAGNGSSPNKKDDTVCAGGGGGLGAKLTPSAVIVVIGKDVQLINLKNQDGISKLIDIAPSVISKFNLGGKKKNDNGDCTVDTEI